MCYKNCILSIFFKIFIITVDVYFNFNFDIEICFLNIFFFFIKNNYVFIESYDEIFKKSLQNFLVFMKQELTYFWYFE
jgi:hypothetical protein